MPKFHPFRTVISFLLKLFCVLVFRANDRVCWGGGGLVGGGGGELRPGRLSAGQLSAGELLFNLKR